ncbi:Zinc finger RING-type [Penicillium taxi]|uniref:Zinc finger RING-type n=1 Tax=Penicillium taxi TaxID=168475 RepID=UPI002545A084|nr:Zinc finger RING-type [Penicillium taxi]KAJ5899635.1 Zinc finger RING-type [Penicillium taxi]
MSGPGLMDVEKELACSICTELLYQPLTLLNCLHTYCGSCLKDWFSAQGSRQVPAGSSRFTCPSCRAEVLDTRPNATVTTLVDMVLAAQPDRARSAEEKEEIAVRYKPGDPIFPPPQAEEDSGDEEDQRLLEEIRDLSLRESQTSARRETRRAGDSRIRGRSTQPERPADDSRRRRREGDTAQRDENAQRSRRIEHQSSLRSILSLSSEAETMQDEILEQILKQIIEEGLLDDINLDELGPAQEEELSEFIADAYRRRHMQQSSSRGQGSDRQRRSQSARRPTETTITARENTGRRPPTSRPHLLDLNQSASGRHERRNSEQVIERRRTSPVRVNQVSNSEDDLRLAVRTSSDITTGRPRSSGAARARESSGHRQRRATESEQNISATWLAGGRTTGQSATNSPTLQVPSPPESSALPLSSPLIPPRSERRSRPSSSRSNAPSSSLQFIEPSISCDRCGERNIQYELHKKCFQCKDGNYHICLRCYRKGQCCPQWKGFGPSAQASYKRMLESSTHNSAPVRENGHILQSFKFQRPPEAAQLTVNGERQTTSDNPARRLEAGLFCDICLSSTNECYWKCNQCNEGDWGFCNRCVNQGRCCTHALLPIRRISENSAFTPSNAVEPAIGTVTAPYTESYKILSFSTNCDICTYPIPASTTRFHCLKCNDGDYDVCTNCYLKLVATSKISKENGHHGWRRCLAGHRMIVVGFEDHDDGQRRVIVRKLVGGCALKDEHLSRFPDSSPAVSPELGVGEWSWTEGQERRKKTTRLRGPEHALSEANAAPTPLRRFPPDGGVGLTVYARWAWYPEGEAAREDELAFPRGADITEVENINNDWFWGCYAGRTGLFPGAHVSLVVSEP